MGGSGFGDRDRAWVGASCRAGTDPQRLGPVHAGTGRGGPPQIRQGMYAYRALGMAMEEPYFLALLAEAHASVDRIEEGHTDLAEALAALPSGRDFFYKAELYRLQGELLRRRSGSDDGQVEAVFSRRLRSPGVSRRNH